MDRFQILGRVDLAQLSATFSRLQSGLFDRVNFYAQRERLVL